MESRAVQTDLPTHPEWRVASEHVVRQEFAQDLQKALQRAIPKNISPYSKVTVLMVTWKQSYESNEADIKTDFNQFDNLMNDYFHFEVEKIFLDSAKGYGYCGRQLTTVCTQNYPEENELTLFYYVGHGHHNEATRHSILCLDAAATSVKIDFSRLVASVLDLADGDVAYIMDACHAAGAGVNQRREVLAASNVDFAASGRTAGTQSFTQALCEIVRQYPGPVSLSQLHARIVYHYCDPNRNMHLHSIPVHVADVRSNKSSVILAPFNAFQQAELSANLDPPEKSPYVLMKISLKNDAPTTTQFKEWLSSAVPEAVQYIEVHGIYTGGSCQILLKIPIVLWNMLRDRVAYVFVGYIKGGNTEIDRLRDALSNAQRRIQELEAQAQRTVAVGGSSRGGGRGDGRGRGRGDGRGGGPRDGRGAGRGKYQENIRRGPSAFQSAAK